MPPGAPVERPALWDWGDNAVRWALVPPDPEEILSPEATAFWERFLDEIDHGRLSELMGMNILTEEYRNFHFPSDMRRYAWPDDPAVRERAEEILLEARAICAEIHEVFRTASVPSPRAHYAPAGSSLASPEGFRLPNNRTRLWTALRLGNVADLELAYARLTGDPIPVVESLRGLHVVHEQMCSWERVDLMFVLILSAQEKMIIGLIGDLVGEFDLEDETLAELDQILVSLEDPYPIPEQSFHRVEHWLTAWLASEESRRGMVDSVTGEGVILRMVSAEAEYRAWREHSFGDSATPEMITDEWLAYGHWVRPHYVEAAANPDAFRAEVERVIGASRADWEVVLNDPFSYTGTWALEEHTRNPLIWEQEGNFGPWSAATERLALAEASRRVARAHIAMRRGDADTLASLIDPFTGEPLIVGPDQVHSIGFDRVDQFGEVEYDPTNGTISGGDIIAGRRTEPLPALHVWEPRTPQVEYDQPSEGGGAFDSQEEGFRWDATPGTASGENLFGGHAGQEFDGQRSTFINYGAVK